MDTGRVVTGRGRSMGAAAPSGTGGNGESSSPAVPVSIVGSGTHHVQPIPSGTTGQQTLAAAFANSAEGGTSPADRQALLVPARAGARALLEQAGLGQTRGRPSALRMLRSRMGQAQPPADSGDLPVVDVTQVRLAARQLLAGQGRPLRRPVVLPLFEPGTPPEPTGYPEPQTPDLQTPTRPSFPPRMSVPPADLNLESVAPEATRPSPAPSHPAPPNPAPSSPALFSPEPKTPTELAKPPRLSQPTTGPLQAPPTVMRYTVVRKGGRSQLVPLEDQGAGGPAAPPPMRHPEVVESKRPPHRGSVVSPVVAPAGDPPPPPRPGPSRPLPADYMGPPVRTGETPAVALFARLQEGLDEYDSSRMPLRRALYCAAAAIYMESLEGRWSERHRAEAQQGLCDLLSHELLISSMQMRMEPPVAGTNPRAAALVWLADFVGDLRSSLANGEVSAEAMMRVQQMLASGMPSQEMMANNVDPQTSHTPLAADVGALFLSTVMGIDERSELAVAQQESVLQQQLEQAQHALDRALNQGSDDVSDLIDAVTECQQALDSYLAANGSGWLGGDRPDPLSLIAHRVYQRSLRNTERRLFARHSEAISDTSQSNNQRQGYYRAGVMVAEQRSRFEELVRAELDRAFGSQDTPAREQLVREQVDRRMAHAENVLWESIVRRLACKESTYTILCKRYMTGMPPQRLREILQALIASQGTWPTPTSSADLAARSAMAAQEQLMSAEAFGRALYAYYGRWLAGTRAEHHRPRPGRLSTVPEDDEQPGPSGVGSPAPGPAPTPTPQPAPSSSSSSESSSDEEEVAAPVYPRPDRPAPHRPAPSRPVPTRPRPVSPSPPSSPEPVVRPSRPPVTRPVPTRPSVSRPHPAPAPQNIQGNHLPGGPFRGHLTPEPERLDLPHYRPPFRDSVSRPGVRVVGPGASGTFSDIYLPHDETGLGNIGSVNAGTGALYLGGGTINLQFAATLIGGRTPDNNPFRDYHRQILTLRPNTHGYIVPDLTTGQGIQGLRYTLCSPSGHEFGTVFVHVFDDNHCPNANGQNRAMVYIVPPDGRSPRYRDNQAFLDDVSETAARLIETVQAYNMMAGQRGLPKLDIIRTCRFSSGNFARKGTTGADVAKAIETGFTLGVFRIREKGQRVTIKEIQYEDGNTRLFSGAGIVDRRALE